MTLDNLVAIVTSGLVLGSLYALMASGLSLVWGTLRIFNFAHGAILAVGAYVAWSVTQVIPGVPGLLGGFLAAVAVTMVLGMLVERVLVRPVLSRPGADLVAMVTTLAAATLIQQVIQLIWGPRFKQLPVVAPGAVDLLGTSISYQNLLIMGLAPAVLLVLRWFLTSTDRGLAIRAVEQNPDGALLAGINVARTYATTFAVASGLAALAGVLLGGIFFMSPIMGMDPLLRAFIVVVFGGLASLGGTVLGAYIIGLIEAASVFFLGLYYTPAVLFAVMFVFMLVRPQGLFGRAR